MTPTTLLELAAAAALIGAGGWLTFKRGGKANDGYGSQSGVILLVIGLIVAIHGLGGLEYRPSEAEMARR